MILKEVKDALADFNFSAIKGVLDKLLAAWFNRGIVISVTLAVGDNVLNHGLNRVLTKIIPVYQNAACSFYYKAPASDIKNTITVNASAAVTVSFYVD